MESYNYKPIILNILEHQSTISRSVGDLSDIGMVRTYHAFSDKGNV